MSDGIFQGQVKILEPENCKIKLFFFFICLTGESWNKNLIVPSMKFDFRCLPLAALFVVSAEAFTPFQYKMYIQQKLECSLRVAGLQLKKPLKNIASNFCKIGSYVHTCTSYC